MPSTILGTQALILPADSTANRPTGVQGMIRFNTSTNQPEWWYTTASSWVAFSTDAPYFADVLLVSF